MELTDDNCWTLQPFWDEHDKLVDKHNDLVKRWNRIVRMTTAPRRQPDSTSPAAGTRRRPTS
jgi:hypothetical protein